MLKKFIIALISTFAIWTGAHGADSRGSNTWSFLPSIESILSAGGWVEHESTWGSKPQSSEKKEGEQEEATQKQEFGKQSWFDQVKERYKKQTQEGQGSRKRSF